MQQRNWRELIKPKRLTVDEDSLSGTYGKFFAEPLERGYGTTLGNALRRILLSSLQGAAIVQVKFEGIHHEFSSIPGVKEDVVEIILNLKDVRLKASTSKQKRLHIDIKGPCVVTAGDITAGSTLEVLNPDEHIATLGEGAHLVGEMVVEVGKGYQPAEMNKNEDMPIGWIPIDAIFSPIEKVNFKVDQARVGQRTDYDKLILEIHTDGSVTPEDALAYSAKILKDQVQVFINFEEAVEEEEGPAEEQETATYNPNLDRKVSELELSVRAANCLKSANIRFIGELVQKNDAEMLKTKNFGRKSLNEIKDILQTMSLHLGMELHGWTPPEEDLEEEEL
ncbi:MAG: DNA-directed RNA polymerase subunit alpha [Deltaproteobacteria bacterium]|nr:MAG: DNA-directed RNA polymerase subunit alpha [Deltaproteobacteria bacterium]